MVLSTSINEEGEINQAYKVERYGFSQKCYGSVKKIRNLLTSRNKNDTINYQFRCEVFDLIKKFEVENFKGFNKKIVFDLNARDYAFNKHIVVNGIVNKAIVYGKNGVGKSSLGIALFDVIWHLTDKERMPVYYLSNYLNLESNVGYAVFHYEFQFDQDEIVYEYGKRDPDSLVYETLWINKETVIDYHYFDRNRRFVNNELRGDLNIELIDNRLSIVKYIYRNKPTNSESPLTKMMQFCERMLWYRSLSDGNCYCGFSNGRAGIIERIYEGGKLRDFEEFLRSNGLDYKLKFVNNNGIHELYAVYEKGQKMTPFLTVASTGTMALLLYYYWSISAFDKISFLFIDEFDAFFHYESAENIILRLNKANSFQTVLTSHNTYLMQNALTRPDCCYIMTENRISSLFNSTDKEIREAHNLEKMYINGAFND